VAKLRILLADDHTLVRQGLRRILEERPDWDVIGEVSDGRSAVQLALAEKPDLVIMDVGMAGLNGIEAARQITRREPSVHVLILSMHADESYITRALQAGAHGYLLKDSADEDLLRAVEAVGNGASFFSPAAARVMLDDYVRLMSAKGVVDRFETLSEREREVLQLIAEGHGNKAIAERLCISVATVETHRAHLLEKLDLHNTAELVLYAVRHGVIA